MLVIRSNIIPFSGFKAVTFWPFVFVRCSVAVGTERYARLLNHEGIHGRQQLEMLFVFFYLWYLLEWVLRSVQYRSFHLGYRNVSFEREAYENENDVHYLESRRLFSWFGYV